MKFRNFNFLNHFIPPKIHTDYDYRLRHSVSSSILIKYKLWPKRLWPETYYGRTGVWPKRLESIAKWQK